MPSDQDDHGKELRSLYVTATAKQRFNVAMQRLRSPDRDPNLLITWVSAVEATSRHLVISSLSHNPAARLEYYEVFRNTGPEALVTAYLLSAYGATPEQEYGEGTWSAFGRAVRYRNLLVHECTYLGQDRTPELIEACRSVLKGLAARAGISAEEI